MRDGHVVESKNAGLKPAATRTVRDRLFHQPATYLLEMKGSPL
jgi:hypothetical protein